MRKIARAKWRKLTCKMRSIVRWKLQERLDGERQEKVLETGNSDIPKVYATWKHIKKIIGEY